MCTRYLIWEEQQKVLPPPPFPSLSAYETQPPPSLFLDAMLNTFIRSTTHLMLLRKNLSILHTKFTQGLPMLRCHVSAELLHVQGREHGHSGTPVQGKPQSGQPQSHSSIITAMQVHDCLMFMHKKANENIGATLRVLHDHGREYNSGTPA